MGISKGESVADLNPAMAAVALFIYSVAAFGVAYAIGHSKLTLSLRNQLARETNDGSTVAYYALTLMECPACLGFWVGLGAGTSSLLFGLPWDCLFLVLPVAGFYTCGINFILGRATRLIIL